MLSDSQIERYSRQILHPRVGGRGQQRLLDAKVSIAVRGALANQVLPYLLGAGVGTIRLFPTHGALSPTFVWDDVNPDCHIHIHDEPLNLTNCDDADVVLAEVEPGDAVASHGDLGSHPSRPTILVALPDFGAIVLRLLATESEPCLACSNMRIADAVRLLADDRPAAPAESAPTARPLAACTRQLAACILAGEAFDMVLGAAIAAQYQAIAWDTSEIRQVPLAACPHVS